MIENILFITKEVTLVFITSITSAYLICKCSNVPFYNPNLSKKELYSSLKKCLKNLGVIGIEVIITANIYYPYIKYENHKIIKSIINIIEYSVLIELYYYIYHILYILFHNLII